MCAQLFLSLQCIAVKYYVQKLQMIVIIARRKWTIFALVVMVEHIHSICLSKFRAPLSTIQSHANRYLINHYRRATTSVASGLKKLF